MSLLVLVGEGMSVYVEMAPASFAFRLPLRECEDGDLSLSGTEREAGGESMAMCRSERGGLGVLFLEL